MKNFKLYYLYLLFSHTFTQSHATLVPIKTWIDQSNFNWMGNTTQIHTLITWSDEFKNYKRSNGAALDNVDCDSKPEVVDTDANPENEDADANPENEDADVNPENEDADEYPWCIDNSKRFETFYKTGKRVNKRCDWVKRNRQKRCTMKNVRQNCPVTCGYCQCIDNENRFLIESGAFSGKTKKCSWVYGNIRKRCKLVGVASNCPLACGRCDDGSGSDTPTRSPTPLPTKTALPTLSSSSIPTERVDDFEGSFEIHSKAWIKEKKTCSWASRQLYRCNIVEVKHFCPYTCRRFGGVESSHPTSTSNQPSNVPKSPKPSSVKITNAPTSKPIKITNAPTSKPTKTKSNKPSMGLSSHPSSSPTLSSNPSSMASSVPSTNPSNIASDAPSLKPSPSHSSRPSSIPSIVISLMPSKSHSSEPTLTPSNIASDVPSLMPTLNHSLGPSAQASSIPSTNPSNIASSMPSFMPTSSHSSEPTVQSSSVPSANPSNIASDVPSLMPTFTHNPSNIASDAPSMMPSLSLKPSAHASSKPSALPSSIPTHSSIPTTTPSKGPSMSPSNDPTLKPSLQPSSKPTETPSSIPSITHSNAPSPKHSENPSTQPSISQLPTSEKGTKIIQSDSNQHCFHRVDTINNETEIILSACDESKNNQQWYIDINGHIRSSLNDNKCVSVQGAEFLVGMPIVINDCDGTDNTQLWEIASDGTLRSRKNSMYCMDGNDLGGQIVLWVCDQTSDQYWTVIDTSITDTPSSTPSISSNVPSLSSAVPTIIPGSLAPTIQNSNEYNAVMIRSNDNGHCIDLPLSDTTNGVQMTLANCDKAESSQNWYFDDNGLIRSFVNSQKCIKVPSFSVSTPIEIQNCNAEDQSQLWTFTSNGEIQSVGNRMYCIDGNDAGSSILLWVCDNTADQVWTLLDHNAPSSVPSSSPSLLSTNIPSVMSVVPTIENNQPTIDINAVMIRSNDNSHCIDLPQGDTTNGARTILSVCDVVESSQQWLIGDNGQVHPSLDQAKCLKVSEFAAGTPIEIDDCDVNDSSQFWTFMSNGEIRSQQRSYYCIDANEAGSELTLWACDNSSDQYWTTVRRISSSPSISPSSSSSSSLLPTAFPTSTNTGTNYNIIMIRSSHNSFCINLPLSNTTNDSLITLSSCDEAETSQNWYFDEYGHIHSSVDGSKCLNVQGTNFMVGMPIVINDCDGTDNTQLWEIASDGTLRSRKNSMYCMDGNDLGGQIVLWVCDQTSDQYWTVIDTSITDTPSSTPSISSNVPSLSSAVPTIIPGSLAPTIQNSNEYNAVMIRSNDNGHCIDLPLSDTTNGVQMTLANCDKAESSQNWYFDDNGLIRSFVNSQKCIKVPSFSVSTPIEIQNCNAEDQSQLWTFTSNGEIQSVGNRMYCIDGNDAGSSILLWVCDNTADQVWTLLDHNAPSSVPSSSPSLLSTNIPSVMSVVPTIENNQPTIDINAVMIRSNDNSHCIDLPQGDTTNGARTILSVCDVVESSQQWLIGDNGQVHPSLDQAKCLKVSEFAAGTPIEIDDCDVNDSSQFWTFMSNGEIRSQQRSYYCIDANEAGSELTLWVCDTSSDQYWTTVDPSE